MQCGDDSTASNGICVPSASSSNAVKGVLANNGTPLYVMAIVSILAGGVGIMIYYDKATHTENLVQQPINKHFLTCLLSTAGFLSEVILAYFSLESGISDLKAPGIVLFVSRFFVAPTPGLWIAFDTLVSSAPLIDEESENKRSKYYVHTPLLFSNSKIYAFLLLLSLFEPPLISFLPWYMSNFAKVAFFPTLRHLRICLLVKFVQIVVTSVAQSMILDFQKDTTDSAFLALLYLNIMFSGLTFVFRASEIVLKWGVLQGSDLSDDVSAARVAHEESTGISSMQSFEMGTVYTDNPMHNGTQKESTANTSMSVTDKSSLLTKIEEQNRLFQDKLSNMENKMRAMEERIDTAPADPV